MNEIEKELKEVKFDLEETKQEYKNLEEKNEELREENRVYGDMLSEARESIHDLRELCEREAKNNDKFNFNIAIIVDELMGILKMVKRTYI